MKIGLEEHHVVRSSLKKYTRKEKMATWRKVVLPKDWKDLKRIKSNSSTPTSSSCALLTVQRSVIDIFG